jgi:hypothetical protein
MVGTLHRHKSNTWRSISTEGQEDRQGWRQSMEYRATPALLRVKSYERQSIGYSAYTSKSIFFVLKLQSLDPLNPEHMPQVEFIGSTYVLLIFNKWRLSPTPKHSGALSSEKLRCVCHKFRVPNIIVVNTKNLLAKQHPATHYSRKGTAHIV